MKKYIVYIGILLMGLYGCGDFLEEQSEDLTYAVNCADLEELLVGGGYAVRRAVDKMDQLNVKSATSGYYLPGLHVMDDDVVEIVQGQAPGSATTGMRLAAFYRWEEDPCNDGDADYDDPSWTALYTHIGVTNAVLDKVEEFTDDSETDRHRVKGQALYLRACYYFYLVNLYAKPYSDITAAEDLGVPLKTFAYIDDRYWGRATVKEVYDQIVSDLKGAVYYLADITPKSYYWIGADAARLLLSRVYCYMGKWELVPGLCDTIMNHNYQLFDAVANAKIPIKDWENSLVHTGTPEIIFTMGSNSRAAIFSTSNGFWNFGVSEELYGLYVEGDYRRNLLVQDQSSYHCPRFELTSTTPAIEIMPESTKKGQDPYMSDIFTLRLPEVYLNRAEALAMIGDEGGARALIQELREKRIDPEVVGTVSESGEDLIQVIRDERRRELAFEGHRWFDLRRYAVCPNYPMTKEIRHAHYSHTTGSSAPGAYEGFYLLPGYPDKNWVLPIPGFEIEENQGVMDINERNKSVFY